MAARLVAKMVVVTNTRVPLRDFESALVVCLWLSSWCLFVGLSVVWSGSVFDFV